ncbi:MULTISPECIES: nitrous oxide reductase family maturation protein NosD [unclassified Actinotalea]|uniref:right-handed parallel beta-helix repeat-containing protein n=1 Tax=unclassified Actinotalea TaxID=2638618 RepID=UPI002107F91B|nr:MULTISPECIES: right-handed parallel beta-helix repeat-containing protein [unclassified Actinotalea]
MTRGRALRLLAGSLVVLAAGCTSPAPEPPPSDDARPEATSAPIEPEESPGGAPVLGEEGEPVSPSPEPSDDEDDEDGDRGRRRGPELLSEPSPFPEWMTRPSPDDGLCPTPTVRVSDADELQDALDDAGPGTVIGLAPGVYIGKFVTTASGTADAPARLCGEADAVLDGDNQRGGYVLHLDGAQHWVLSGFTVRNGQKGVMADGTTGTTISGLTVYGIGDEGIHLRAHSTDNLVAHNTISDTGRRREKFGEGVYVGTANSNWCRITDCDPDLSDRNQVIGNAVYAGTSESVDIKEGTSDGLVEGNQFDGSTITGADSWVDVKGNDWTIRDNVGHGTPMDGFQTHDVYEGWGEQNEFLDNEGSLDDPEGFLVAMRPANDNVARCSNRLLGDIGELSNERCV